MQVQFGSQTKVDLGSELGVHFDMRWARRVATRESELYVGFALEFGSPGQVPPKVPILLGFPCRILEEVLGISYKTHSYRLHR